LKPIFVPSLRYPRVWFFAGVLIALVVTFYSLLPAERLPQVGVSDKIEHIVAYALLGFWFASVVARWDYIFMLLALLALGGGIEIVQGLMKMGREADILDFVADCVGAGGGVVLALTPLGRWPLLIERLLSRKDR
jgi:VanZ family protein